MGVQISNANGQVLGERICRGISDGTAARWVKTAEPIEMPFELRLGWAQVRRCTLALPSECH